MTCNRSSSVLAAHAACARTPNASHAQPSALLQISIFFGNTMFAIVHILVFNMPVDEAVSQALLLTLVQSVIELVVHTLAISAEARMGIPVIEAWRARYKYQFLVVAANGVLATLYVRSWVVWVVTSAVESAES
jgi:hypothetical protein